MVGSNAVGSKCREGSIVFGYDRPEGLTHYIKEFGRGRLSHDQMVNSNLVKAKLLRVSFELGHELKANSTTYKREYCDHGVADFNATDGKYNKRLPKSQKICRNPLKAPPELDKEAINKIIKSRISAEKYQTNIFLGSDEPTDETTYNDLMNDWRPTPVRPPIHQDIRTNHVINPGFSRDVDKRSVTQDNYSYYGHSFNLINKVSDDEIKERMKHVACSDSISCLTPNKEHRKLVSMTHKDFWTPLNELRGKNKKVLIIPYSRGFGASVRAAMHSGPLDPYTTEYATTCGWRGRNKGVDRFYKTYQPCVTFPCPCIKKDY